MESVEWVEKRHQAHPCVLTRTPSHDDEGRTRVCFSVSDIQKENAWSSQRREKEGPHLSHSQWCETPKLTRKGVSLRRCLLAAKSLTEVKRSVSGTPHTHEEPESLNVLPSGPLSYRSDAMLMSCMKRRLVFSQAITSTLEGRRDGTSPLLSEPDLDESIISGLLPSETPEMQRGRDCFRTPVTHLATDLSESLSVLCTPSCTPSCSRSCTPVSRLDASEDSGFGSLRLDGSEDAGDDCSFQERGTRVTVGRDPSRARLERQRRLSTLREGSHSDDEVKGRHTNRRSLKLEEEVFVETPPLRARQRDLSLTPALQAVEVLSRSFTLSHDPDRSISTLLNLTHDSDQPITTRLPLSQLIGRKMGLGKMDVFTELHVRNLHHILSSILQLLSAKDIHTCSLVCGSWSEIILQDRNANHRRKTYKREQKHAQEMGGAVRVVDAETRLAVACRSALGSVQAQAKTPGGPHTHTPATCGAYTKSTHTPPSSKRQQFLQVAKTLFSDECLRPCPRCERPARCHSVKAEGVCTWSECVFHFCTSCLRAYHGSADCPNIRTHRKGRSQLLPGSAQSKRNVRRL